MLAYKLFYFVSVALKKNYLVANTCDAAFKDVEKQKTLNYTEEKDINNYDDTKRYQRLFVS